MSLSLFQTVALWFKGLLKKRYVTYPFLVVAAIVLASHLWFAITHYRLFQAVPSTLQFKHFHLVPFGKRFPYKYQVKSPQTAACFLPTVYLYYPEKKSYYFYPLETPRYLPTLLNLDRDPEPEILYNGARGLFSYSPMVYDYNAKTKRFTRKSLTVFSWSIYLYAREIEDFLWGPLTILLGLLCFALLAYYVLLGVGYALWRLWKVMQGEKKEPCEEEKGLGHEV